VMVLCGLMWVNVGGDFQITNGRVRLRRRRLTTKPGIRGAHPRDQDKINRNPERAQQKSLLIYPLPGLPGFPRDVV